MKIKKIEPTVVKHAGWLDKRFGDCWAPIGTETTLKLKSAILDVHRALYGFVEPDVMALSKNLPNPPQGIDTKAVVFGYEDDTGAWVPGQIEKDENLKAYVRKYPKEWEIVQKCLGLTRQKSRHACLPASEVISTKEGLKGITECNQIEVLTGLGNSAKATLIAQGMKEVWEFQLEDGQTIRCTPDHQILTIQGWMSIQAAFQQSVELVAPKECLKP